MPRVIDKLYAGRAEQQKRQLADAISKAVTTTLKVDANSISVAIEDFPPTDWAEKVYRPEISGKPGLI